MLPTSRWMLDLDQATPFDLDRPERLDRMERVPLWARPRRPDPAPRSLVRMADRLRERISSWAARGSLGPLPDRCAGDPAGPCF